MECLADIIWTASRRIGLIASHTHAHEKEIDHNLLCQPHNKTISGLNEAGAGDEESQTVWGGGGGWKQGY